MASEQTRNTVVGLTVIAGIAVFVIGLSFLNLIPKFFKTKSYEVKVQAANAGGVSAGTRVTLNGIQIGTVKGATTVINAGPPASATSPAETRLPATYALVILEIAENYNIPTGTTAQVGGTSIGIGTVSVSLNPPAVASGTFIPKDGTATLEGIPADSGLLPPGVFADLHAMKENLTMVSNEIGAASREIAVVARDLHTLLTMREIGPDGKPVVQDPTRPPENIFTLVLKLNKTIDYLNGILSDPKLPGNISAIAANLAEDSAKLKQVMDDINKAFNETTRKIGDAADTFNATIKSADPAIANISAAAKSASTTLDLAQARITAISEDLSHTLKNLDASVNAITSGDGTTGKLVKDAKLYDGLVDLTNSLKATTDDINRLVHQWRQDGVPLKVGIGGK